MSVSEEQGVRKANRTQRKQPVSKPSSRDFLSNDEKRLVLF